MPAVVLSRKLRRFRRRFGITAPKVVVRSHLPWHWLALAVVLLVLLLGAGGWLVAQRNVAGGLEREIERLNQQLIRQGEELNVLRSTEGTGQNAASIERATQQQLLGKIQRLEAQNAALKEDILLFERLIPATGDAGGIRIENFQLVREAKGRISYRLLLAFQSDRQTPDFRGRLQLVVDYALSGRSAQLLLPDRQESLADYQLEFKRLLRREGGFVLPDGAVLRGVEVRIFQGDTLKLKHMVQP